MWADPIAFPTLLLAQHPPAAIHPSQENNHPRQQRHCSLAKSSPALKKKKMKAGLSRDSASRSQL